jgi:hypothetical protein
VKSLCGKHLKPSISLMTSSKVHTDCSSMSKSSEKAPASGNFGSAIKHWRVCRGGSKMQSLDGSTNHNKLIWSVFHVFFDVQNQRYAANHLTKTAGIWTGESITLRLLCVIRYLHLHSCWVTIDGFHSVVYPSRATKNHHVSQIEDVCYFRQKCYFISRKE